MDKEIYRNKAKSTIDKLFNQIDDLESKKDNLESDAKMRYEAKISELKDKKIELENKYKDLKSTSEEKWEEVKTIFSESVDDFNSGISKITSIF